MVLSRHGLKDIYDLLCRQKPHWKDELFSKLFPRLKRSQTWNVSKDGTVDPISSLSDTASPILESGSTSEYSFASNFQRTKKMPRQPLTGDFYIFWPFHFRQRGQKSICTLKVKVSLSNQVTFIELNLSGSNQMHHSRCYVIEFSSFATAVAPFPEPNMCGFDDQSLSGKLMEVSSTAFCELCNTFSMITT